MTMEKQLSEEESLLIIGQMIDQAKQENKEDGKGWILWGWLLLLTSLFSFVNYRLNLFSQYTFWNGFGILALIYFLYRTFKYFFFRRAERVKTYTGDLLQRLNIGFIISLFFIIVAMNIKIDPVAGFSILINLYGFWLLIYGTALNFKPFTIGAILTWAIGLVSLFVNTFDKVMLLYAAAVLCGYIIPGHLANNEFRKTQRARRIGPHIAFAAKAGRDLAADRRKGS
jgi:hypothetical protein